MKTKWCDQTMTFVLAAMAGGALGSTGCDREQPAAPTQEVRGETKPEPAVMPEPAVKPEPAPAVQPDLVPAVPTVGPIEIASPEAGIEPPQKARVLELARGMGFAKPALATMLAEAGPRRYVAVLRDRNGDEPAEYSLHLILLRSPEPATGAEPQWEAQGVLELHRWRGEWMEDADAGKIPTTLVVDDYEHDGEVEALVRFRHTIMCPGGGPNEITELRMVELEPALGVVLQTELHHEMVPVQTKGVVHHEDLDGDQHPDLRIRYTTGDEDGPEPRLQESRWRWVASDDRWTVDSLGATLPGYEGKGCDW